MNKTRSVRYARVPEMPFIGSLCGARLDSFYEEEYGERRDLIVDYHELCPSEPEEMWEEGGRISERVKGNFVPRRLRFSGLRSVQREGLYTDLDAVPLDHPARSLPGLICWIPPDEQELATIFNNRSNEPASLFVKSQGCMQEAREGEVEPVEITRDWSPPPPVRAGLIYEAQPAQIRDGGDPVRFNLESGMCDQCLFVGGQEHQTEKRPQVDAVLNVGEDPSKWVKNGPLDPRDRWVVRGEGDKGMGVQELSEEAAWVIERLRQGQRVLVHCVAAFNRSVTVCCAVLILLEGLSAEAALERVREQHPWARPDWNHWLVLKWMGKNKISS